MGENRKRVMLILTHGIKGHTDINKHIKRKLLLTAECHDLCRKMAEIENHHLATDHGKNLYGEGTLMDEGWHLPCPHCLLSPCLSRKEERNVMQERPGRCHFSRQPKGTSPEMAKINAVHQ
jgi:hypothetical protein